MLIGQTWEGGSLKPTQHTEHVDAFRPGRAAGVDTGGAQRLGVAQRHDDGQSEAERLVRKWRCRCRAMAISLWLSTRGWQSSRALCSYPCRRTEDSSGTPSRQ
jgi:hypothetical protein